MKKFILLAALASLFCFDAFSRAGGGSGGGHGGSGFGGGGYHSHFYGHGHTDPLGPAGIFFVILFCFIPLAFTLFAFFGFAFVLRRQIKQTKEELRISAKMDVMWNEQTLVAHVKDVFLQVQSAWTQRELKLVSDITTLHFISKYQPLLNYYKKRGIVNMMSNIHINQVSIVDIHDSPNNDQDTFRAYIRGFMKDSFVREKGFTTAMVNDQERTEFEDVYLFVRKGNKWLLNDIINDPESGDIGNQNNRY